MNRTLRRPMFRMGGSAGEGITSGLAPRQGYQSAGSVRPLDFPGSDAEWQAQQQRLKELGIIDAQGKRVGGSKKQSLGSGQPGGTFVGGGAGSTISGGMGGNAQSKLAEKMNILDAMYPRKPRGDTNMRDFLINFGLDIASRPPSGSIFSTAAAAAKGPFEKFQQAKQIEEAYGMKETSEDRALLASMLEGMDDDKLSALMKDVKAGVEAGEFPDEKTGIKLLLQKKIYGVLPMEGEVYEDNIKDIEKQLQREDIPTLMLRSLA